MNRNFENWYPWIGGGAAIAISAWCPPDFPAASEKEILTASLTVGAILTGFLATAKTILLSLRSDVMDDLRSSNYMKDLISYLAQAIWLAFAYCVFVISGFFFGGQWYAVIWLALGITAALAFIRIVHILLLILRYSNDENRQRE